MPPADFDPQHPETLRSLRAMAEQAARAGGEVARQYFGGRYEVQLKPDLSEVTDADHAAQAAIVAALRGQRPGDALLAEERLDLAEPTPAPTNDRLCWIIDPLDGTRNFVRHIPLYTSAVAAMFGGEPLAGAIYDPERDTLYSASRAGGLFINGHLQPARHEQPPRRRGPNPKLVVALPSTPTALTAPRAHAWLDQHVCRSLGSTSLHLALVASGEFDGMLADNARLWDLAAGGALVTAAGGRLTTLDGAPRFPVDVASYLNQELPTVAAGPGLAARLGKDL